MFSDILTPLPALGLDFDVVKGVGPVIPTPVRSLAAVQQLHALDLAAVPFVRPVLQALRSEVGSSATVVGFVGTPWTLAAYAVEGGATKDCATVKRLMHHSPEVLHALLAVLADGVGEYAVHQADSGAQVLQLFDSWAHHLSPQQFQEFSLPYAQARRGGGGAGGRAGPGRARARGRRR